MDLPRDPRVVVDPLLEGEDQEASAHHEHKHAPADQDEAHHELRLGVAGHEGDLSRSHQKGVDRDRKHDGPDHPQPRSRERGLVRAELVRLALADTAMHLTEVEHNEVEREEVDAREDALPQPHREARVLAEEGRAGGEAEGHEREDDMRQPDHEGDTHHVFRRVE